MFNNNSFFEDLISVGLMGGMYYAGRCNGYNDAHAVNVQRNKDLEIETLKLQIEELKRKP